MDYILFDLDGTLTDPKEGITKCVQYALKHFGIEVSDLDSLLNFIGPPLDVSFKEYYGFSDDEAKEAVKKYRERFSKTGIFENRAYDGICELLSELKSFGKILAVATSKPYVFAKRILEKYELAPYFDAVAGSTLDGGFGTKAEVIDEAIRLLGNPDKSRIIMVGDRKHDIIGAKTSGIKSVGVKYGYAEEGELEAYGADYIAEDLKELKRILLA